MFENQSPEYRARIRKIIIDRGAPARDIDWLAASCPSAKDAETYNPPPAWAFRGGKVPK